MAAYLSISLFFVIVLQATNGLQLVTTSNIRGVRPDDLHRFLATPTNWPKIVASSQSVRPPGDGPSNRVDVPLRVGERVEEIFGLPPILPLSVSWECVQSDVSNGALDFYSADGLRGIAKDCRMKFRIMSTKGDGSGSDVTLTMIYEPLSPLAVLATPVLTLDNALALKLLLPNAI
mmetsp:Transcript_12015/g.35131  ORF Transcript_12015/g.35131 Transcript_12015/m.35131 type:complete len:176 (-) Transcript_12015:54-581(-)